MILDHSMFSGLADMHDRHRDMRLDVDNMSYEVKTSFAHFNACLAYILSLYFTVRKFLIMQHL
jgi:hypothetical protein